MFVLDCSGLKRCMCGVSGNVRPCSGLSSWFKLWKTTSPAHVLFSLPGLPVLWVMQLPDHTTIELCHWQRGASSLFQLPEDEESLSILLYKVVSKQRVRSDVDVDARNSMLSQGSVASRKRGGWSPWWTVGSSVFFKPMFVEQTWVKKTRLRMQP